MLPSQDDAHDLRDQYPLYVELGFVLALSFAIVAVQVDISTGSGITVEVRPEETVDLKQIDPVQHESEPPPPPRPPVPQEVPNNTPITEKHTSDGSIDLDDPLRGQERPSPAEEPTTSDEDPFVRVEQMPTLIGGMKALQQSVEYPEAAKRAGLEGRVTVQFVVDEEGNVRNPTILDSVHELLDEEAIEAVKQQQFKPGTQRGAPVKVEMSLPVYFRLR